MTNPSKTQALYTYAKTRIPGGTELLSKRPEMMAPEVWPAYFKQAKGVETTDLDGRTYYDFSTMSVGANLLGFADPDVNEAVMKIVAAGSMSSLNPPEEVELADRLCAIHPWATQARFTRAGGESLAVAVRIARATTDRSLVVVAGYHGWHDWYLAANLGDSHALRGIHLDGLSPWGVPEELRGTTFPCRHGDTEHLKSLIEKHGDKIAAIVMEPCRHEWPVPGFLEFTREACDRHGIILIFDEVSIGWRWRHGGAHLSMGVSPDIAVFSKALGNGYPIGAVIGTAEAMEGSHKSFISSTYWTERIGPAAALATIDKLGKCQVAEHVNAYGSKVTAIWRQAGEKTGLKIKDTTHPDFGCLATFVFDYPEALKIRTLYTQLMLDRGFLAGAAIYPSLAHTEALLTQFATAVEESFAELRGHLENGTVDAARRGPVAQTGFQRLVK